MSTEKNKFKIVANPYKCEINYYYWNEENDDYAECGCSSIFSKKEFTNAVIWNKGYEIIQEINKNYNQGNVGLELEFYGTKEDKDELSYIIDEYFSDKGIVLVSDDSYLRSAVDVKKGIEDIFTHMGELFSQYQNSEITEYINKFNDAVRPTIPICVMGLYSSGKSAFINSILGIELLPSASDPTTAKTYKIRSGNEYKIKFCFENNEITLTFEDEKYCISHPAEFDIVTKLDEAIQEKKTFEERMYCALSIINNYDMECHKKLENEHKRELSEAEKIWKVSDLIEVILPIKSSVLPFDKFDFIIIDTPGSNSAHNIDHIEVLKNAMKGLTNGLPIFVTTPDAMDAKDNIELVNTIDRLGGALDKGNLLIVVNKADEKSTQTLEDKKNNIKDSAILKLNPAEIYFVSSVMGLGFKKILNGNTTKVEDEDDEGNTISIIEPKWIDKDYCNTFGKNKKNFKKKKNPTSLYKYNIISQHKKDRYEAIELGEKNAAYRNSGLHAVEYTIREFSLNYALYNKCRNASDYLSKALIVLEKQISEKKGKVEKILKEINTSISKEEKELIDKLNAKSKEKKAEYTENYKKVYGPFTTNEISDWILTLDKTIKKFWSETKGEGNRTCLMTNKVNTFLKQKVDRMRKNMFPFVKNFWEENQKDFKKEIISIIVSSDSLTTEQQQLLKNAIMAIDSMPNYKNFSNIKTQEVVGHFLFMKRLKLNQIIDKIKTTYLLQCLDASIEIGSKYDQAFNNMIKEVENQFYNLITKHNPQLHYLICQKMECDKEIDSLTSQAGEIENDKSTIENLIKLI